VVPPEGGQGGVVGELVGREHPVGDLLVGGPLDLPRRGLAGAVGPARDTSLPSSPPVEEGRRLSLVGGKGAVHTTVFLSTLGGVMWHHIVIFIGDLSPGNVRSLRRGVGLLYNPVP